MPSYQASGHPTPSRRRQNTNCDQCRVGKRGCDVQVNAQHSSAGGFTGVSPRDSHKASKCLTFSPCTNCKRWKKRCTIEWIESRRKLPSKSPVFQKQNQIFATAVDEDISPEPLMNTTSSSWYHDVANLQFDRCVPGLSASESYPDSSSMKSQSTSAFGPFSGLWDDNSSFTDLQIQQDFNCDTYLQHSEPYMSHTNVYRNLMDQRSGSDTDFFSAHDNRVDDYVEQYGSFIQASDGQTHQIRSHRKENYFIPADGSSTSYTAASPFTLHLLAEDYNRLSIKKGLLKIYHDSLEGALGCWLTERNCPYTNTVFDGNDVWSSKWANRIVSRVCTLDIAYSKIENLSKRDQQQASNVLDLVVMAFAAQWSQTGQRGNSRSPDSITSLSNPLDSATEKDNETNFRQLDSDVFERNMQKSLWHQANRALCEASENVSFRVIFAGIIFSLTQRPIDSVEVLQSMHSGQQSGLASLYKILDLDGPPIFLDIALRKLHDHQRKLEDAKRDAAENPLKSQALQQLLPIHRETFGLLYWLAVMFDTLSAAVNRRSFTVCDTDSNFTCGDSFANTSIPLDLPFDLNGWSGFSNAVKPSCVRELNIWGKYFLDQQSQVGDFRKQNVRWPCSYVDAASCLADAAPVKVLLFRRVAQLQSLFYQRASAEAIESGIDAVMDVYSHWNNTYGRFINDCARHHEDLPTRIQSWYILLAGHWNLALLIVSDLIKQLDNANMTMLFNRCKRQSEEFTRTLRLGAAFAVSDLGRNSHYGNEDLSFSQAPDFHHAVNKAALLTEPWTMVLVRSFGYAGAALADLVLSPQKLDPRAAIGRSTEARKHLQHCIDALWLLGKKSDMAMCAAQVLRQAVN